MWKRLAIRDTVATVASGVNGCRILAGTSWPNRKYVTDAHRALIPTCRHSLKIRSGWRHSSCKIRTITVSRTVSRSCLYRKRWLHRTHLSSAGNVITILSNLGDIRHFVPGWPYIAGDASPASPAALTPMTVALFSRVDAELTERSLVIHRVKVT